MKKLLALTLAGMLAVSASVPAFAALGDGAIDVHADATGAIYLKDGDPAGTADKEVQPDKSVYIDLTQITWDNQDYIGSGAGTTQADNSTGYSAGNQHAPGAFGGGILSDQQKALAKAFVDKDLFRFKSSKGDDDKKIIEKISVVEKDIGVGAGRRPYIQIDLKDEYTDKEYKITPSFTFTAKCNMYSPRIGTLQEMTGDFSDHSTEINVRGGVQKGSKYIIEARALRNGPGGAASDRGAIYIANLLGSDSDSNWMAGTGGYVAKPVKNEDNTVTWENENRDLAKLEFYADSDTLKYFPKLSTKWDDSDYAEHFAEQDAFIFTFVGNPKISSTVRPTLTIYDPYYDEDEDESGADPDLLAIYEVNADGELIDVTATFTYGEDEDGNLCFTTKTRTLGTYIFVEKSLVDVSAEEPEDTDKTIPNTGL